MSELKPCPLCGAVKPGISEQEHNKILEELAQVIIEVNQRHHAAKEEAEK